MILCNLYSGSRGNATFVRLGETRILIDAGKSSRCLCHALESIGESIDNINAIFLTHEHRDHTSALPILLKNREIPVHTVSASLQKMIAVGDAPRLELFVAHPPLFSVTIGQLTVSSFPTPHDSVASVGYRLEWQDENGPHAVGYATDTGMVTDEMKHGMMGCEACVVESNHDVEMLKEGPYVYALKRRILSRNGHLSNEDCSCFCTQLVKSGTKRILLAHLSEQNNLPELAFEQTAGALAGTNVQISVASPDHPTWLMGAEERQILC